MIPFAFPNVAPAITLGELLGPLAPLVAVAVLIGLAVLTASFVSVSGPAMRRRLRLWKGAVGRRRRRATNLRPA